MRFVLRGAWRSVPAVDRNRSGVLAALAAFFLWGILPVYWKALDFLPPPAIVAQRTLWSLVILLGILAWRREGRTLRDGMRNPRAAGWQLLAGALLASNWLLYVWATLNGRIIECALGYYLNPFFNMLFGFLWFGERHTRLQLVAIALALSGVALQMPAVGRFPWVALTLALTFALYAVVKKRAPLGARLGLTAETAMLAPIALTWLMLHSASPAAAFGASWPHAALVVGAGLATTLPLICFGHAVRTIRLTTLGILQFLGPTLQFLIGWQLYHEPMTGPRLLSFALIWLAVAIYAADAAMRRNRQSEI
ncbi:MAG: EamA family transporter RarD [Verrucomicrobia bacterium]|nr:EamA family transporter RarD [Verrucomicrobiota bacterium]